MVGPVWQKTVDGDWYLPEKTLGWGVLEWLSEYVNTPGGHDDPARMAMLLAFWDAGSQISEKAFIPTDEQVRFILWWYAVDERGSYVYREGCFRRMKGAGKDPLIAALALVELCGPVAFSHFDDNGEPVGKTRHAAWVQIAAVSQDQTKNTFRLFPIMVSEKLKATYGLEMHKFLMYTAAGGQMEAVTASPASMEGNRPTFVIENEIQW